MYEVLCLPHGLPSLITPLSLFLSSPGYIAGVTNLIFESSKSWDLLCDVSTGRMVVSKDISTTYPYSPPPTLTSQLVSRTGTLKAESSVGSEEEFGKLRPDYSSSKSENYDNMFMEDVRSPSPTYFPDIVNSHLARS